MYPELHLLLLPARPTPNGDSWAFLRKKHPLAINSRSSPSAAMSILFSTEKHLQGREIDGRTPAGEKVMGSG